MAPWIPLYSPTAHFRMMEQAVALKATPPAQPTNDLEYYLQAMSENMKLHSKVRKLEEELAIAKAKSNGR